MKVAVLEFFTNPGGVTSMLSELGPHLNDGDDRFVFIDPLPGGFEKTFGLAVQPLPVWPRWMIVTHPSRLVRLLKQGIAAAGYVVYAFRLASYLRRERYTGLYVHLKKGILVGSLASVFSGIPFYVHAHGFGRPQEIHGPLRWAMKRARRIFTVSEDVRRTLIAGGIDARQLQTVHNGLDLQRWQRPVGITTKPGRLIYVGAVQRLKGVHVLIQAFAALPDARERELLIVGEVPVGGDTAYLDHLRQFVKSAGLEAQVQFMGRRTDIAALLASSHALVLPSLTNESFGMVLVEAAAVGTLAVGSDTGGIPEVLGNSELLVPVGDVPTLTTRLQLLFEDHDWYAQQLSILQNHIRQFDVRQQAKHLRHSMSTPVEGQ